ncbi:MAG: LptF/LptG family permease, partial [Desulfomonilia bacterium]
LRQSGIASPATETLYYSRISFALAPFIITILVIPFGMRFPRAGGIARGISLGLVLGLSYWFLHSGLTGLGVSGVIHPLAASWGANAAALILAFSILLKKRRALYG